MGLFSKAFKSIARVVTAPARGLGALLQATAAEVGRLPQNIENIATEALPIVAALAPGPVGAIARIAIAQQAPPPPFVPSQLTGRPVGLAGFAAQSQRVTFGPQFNQAQQFGQQRLPQRSQFAFQPQPFAGFGGFSAPFQAQNFQSGASGFFGAARSPFAFGGQQNIFPQQSFFGAPRQQQQFFQPQQPQFFQPQQQFQQFARPAFGGFGGFRSFF